MADSEARVFTLSTLERWKQQQPFVARQPEPMEQHQAKDVGGTEALASARLQHPGRSYKALIVQRSVAMCCCLVDSILRLPRPSSNRPQVNRYRRSWHCLAGLLCGLVALTAAQSFASGVGFAVCTRQLGSCVPFLERDPCLKAAVPFFVVSLVWLSIFCSCCCQSPKALAVFLLVGLCGEAVLGSYMVAFDPSVRVDDQLRVQLKAALNADCARQAAPPKTAAAVRCFRPLHDDVFSCRKLEGHLPRLCNRTVGQFNAGTQKQQQLLGSAGVAVVFHVDSCIADLLEVIGAKKQLHQTVTYSLLFAFACCHLVLAIALCGYDVQRKRMEKSLLMQDGADKSHGNGQLRQLEIHVNMNAGSEPQPVNQPDLDSRTPRLPPRQPRPPLPATFQASFGSSSGQTLPLLTTASGGFESLRPCGRVTFDMDKQM